MPDLERICLTIHYACGCSTIRLVRREDYEQDFPMHAHEDNRNITAPESCALCKGLALRAWERKLERRGVAG